MLYQLTKPVLFALDPEKAHQLALWGFKHLGGLMAANMHYKPVKVMGLHFPNRVGLAAGFDKNGQAIEALFKCGFGHLEVGTLTPKPQAGNPKPRLFRLTRDHAIINRMGFNNHGVDAFMSQPKPVRAGILGVNIGKNKATPESEAINDYVYGLEHVYLTADYVTINVSSPNTPNLRALEKGEKLGQLLSILSEHRKALEDKHQKRVPLVVKLSPDLEDDELKASCEQILRCQLDGIIATNTTLARDSLKSPQKTESGGLSGKPLTEKATDVVFKLNNYCQGAVPIIAAGGIMSVKDAAAKIQAGASLVQIYTGFIYYGPSLVHRIAKAL